MMTKRRCLSDAVKADMVHRYLSGKVALSELAAAGIGKVHAVMAIEHRVVHAVERFPAIPRRDRLKAFAGSVD